MSSEGAPTQSHRRGQGARRARFSVSISPRTSPSWTAQPPAPQARGVRGRPGTQPVRLPHRRLRRGTRTPATGGLVAATTPQSRRGRLEACSLGAAALRAHLIQEWRMTHSDGSARRALASPGGGGAAAVGPPRGGTTKERGGGGGSARGGGDFAGV